MNKILIFAFSAAALFSLSPASASDGVLFSNSSDPYFTTPEEFRALSKKNDRAFDREYQGMAGAAARADRISTPMVRQNDPARTGYSGR